MCVLADNVVGGVSGNVVVFAVVVGDVLGEVIHGPNCQWEKIWGIV